MLRSSSTKAIVGMKIPIPSIYERRHPLGLHMHDLWLHAEASRLKCDVHAPVVGHGNASQALLDRHFDC